MNNLSEDIKLNFVSIVIFFNQDFIIIPRPADLVYYRFFGISWVAEHENRGRLAEKLGLYP